MKTRWISSLQDRPRCRASNGDGRRCREPVLWGERSNRPLSTRCEVHGGLADAAMTTRTTALGRQLRGLPALALAVALCLSWAAPALADFEAAVAAYNRGDYREAQSEFEALAAAGDTRADAYLDRISDRLRDGSQASGSVTSTLMETVSSVFDDSNESSSQSASAADSGVSRTSASAEPGKGGTGGKPADRKPGMLLDRSPSSASTPPSSQSDVVVPPRKSIWSTIFHLPGDATVIGLQYVAHYLSADNLYRELQILSRASDKIALSILAVGWWLVIIKVLVGFGMAVSRIVKVAATPKEQQNYG